MAEDLAGLVDALGLERFHLLGVSMGGMIAQEYAIAHSDRLLSASLCCTYSYPGPFCLRMFSCWRDLVPSLGVGFTQREVMLWAFTTDFFEQREDELIEIEEFMANNPQPTEAYLAQLHSIEQHDTRGRLAAVQCPVADAGRRGRPHHLPEALPPPARRAPAVDLGRGGGRPRVPVGVPGRVQRRRALVPGAGAGLAAGTGLRPGVASAVLAVVAAAAVLAPARAFADDAAVLRDDDAASASNRRLARGGRRQAAGRTRCSASTTRPAISRRR